MSSPELKAYTVSAVEEAVVIDGRWEKAPWKDLPALSLDCHMDRPPAFWPRTQAKLAYRASDLYLIFYVEDCFVRSVVTERHGPVCKDSCVECFFTPSEQVSSGYFNLEINCGGMMLFHHQTAPQQDCRPMDPALCDAVELAHTQPAVVEPEIGVPVSWTVECRIPLAGLTKGYGEFVPPAPGAVWRANFYKCASHTSNPHWLTWAPIERPRPDFHVPECFGRLVFE